MDNKYVNKDTKKVILVVKSAVKTIQRENVEESSWRVGLWLL